MPQENYIVPVHVTQTTLFGEDDLEFKGDDWGVILQVRWSDDHESTITFGDYYHDKGPIKAEAYIAAFELINPKLTTRQRQENV